MSRPTWRCGQSLSSQITAPLVTVAPTSAVLRDDENLAFVYVAQSDGAFARRHVTLGDRTGDRYAIAEGLRAGEKIVANGALFLQFMETQ